MRLDDWLVLRAASAFSILVRTVSLVNGLMM
jgi:hypothetical protein